MRKLCPREEEATRADRREITKIIIRYSLLQQIHKLIRYLLKSIYVCMYIGKLRSSFLSLSFSSLFILSLTKKHTRAQTHTHTTTTKKSNNDDETKIYYFFSTPYWIFLSVLRERERKKNAAK